MKSGVGHWLDMVEVIFAAKTGNLRTLAELAGGDPATFYLGTDLRGLSLSGEVEDVGSSAGATTPKEKKPDYDVAPPLPSVSQVMMVGLDKAAARVMKLISPDRIRMGLSDGDLQSLGLDPAAFTRFAFDTLNITGSTSVPEFAGIMSGYEVVIFLFDGATPVGELERRLKQIIRRLGPAPDALLLGAPILRSDAPSGAFAKILYQKSDRLGLPCLIDTSVARSPFWPARSKHSFDRRMADLILAGVWNSVHNWQLRGFLKDKFPNYCFLMSLAWGGRSTATGRMDLISENSAVGTAGLTQDKPSFTFDFSIGPSGSSGKQWQHGNGVLHRYEGNFPGFAFAVIEQVMGIHRREVLRSLDVRMAMDLALAYPMYAATFEVDSQRFVVTAETPSLETIRRAGELDCFVVRYTDEDSLKAFVNGNIEKRRLISLPAEVSLPDLGSIGENVRLATRGVDPRDIIEVSERTYAGLSPEFGRSFLGGRIRQYRETLYGESDRRILPLHEVFQRAQSGDDDAATILSAAVEKGGWRTGRPPAKRLGDLEVAWAPVADGARRYVLQDGGLPIELNILEEFEIPAQNMFIIDGDAGVPALFTSRLFNIWARATRTLSMGWPSRFAIGKTFETFPIPELFTVSPSQPGRPATLYTDPGFTNLANIRPDSILALIRRDRGHMPASDVMERLDAQFLEWLRLKSGASDFDVLERLVEVNSRRGKPNYGAVEK